MNTKQVYRFDAEQSVIDAVKPMSDRLKEVLDWMVDQDGINKYLEKSTIDDGTIYPPAPYTDILIEVLTLAHENGINVKRLVQNSVLRFVGETHGFGYDCGGKELRYIYEDSL